MGDALRFYRPGRGVCSSSAYTHVSATSLRYHLATTIVTCSISFTKTVTCYCNTDDWAILAHSHIIDSDVNQWYAPRW